MSLKIVDVSSHQGKYNVGSVNEDGVIAKATEGTGYVNRPYCDYVIQQAINNNLPCGVYHFAYNVNNGRAEAEYFYNNTINYYKNDNMIAVLDFEIGNVNESQIRNYVKQFKARFNELSGSSCLWLYGGGNVSKIAKEFNIPFWLAYYPYASSETSPATWQPATFGSTGAKLLGNTLLSMWQFTTSGGKLDRSLFYGSREQWKKLTVKYNK